MASQWQNVSIPFAQGVDTKSDPRQLNTSGIVELVNGEFDGINRINKRTGFASCGAGIEVSQLVEAQRGVLGIGADGALSIEAGRDPFIIEDTGIMACTRQEFGPINDTYWGMAVGVSSSALGLPYVIFLGNRAELYWRRGGENNYAGSVEISSSSDYWFVGAFSSNSTFSGDRTFGIVYGEDQTLFVRRLNFDTQTLTSPTTIASTVYKRASAGQGNSLMAYMAAPHDDSATQRVVCWINESNNPSQNWDEYARSVVVGDSSVVVGQAQGGALISSTATAPTANLFNEPISCACARDTDNNIFTAMAQLDGADLNVRVGALNPFTDGYSEADGVTVDIPWENGSDALGSKAALFGAPNNNDKLMEVQLAVVPNPDTANSVYVFVAINGIGKVVYFTATRPATPGGSLITGSVTELADNVNETHNAGVAWKLHGQPFARNGKIYVPLIEISRRNSDGFTESDSATDADAQEARRVYMVELPGRKIVAVPIPDLLPADFSAGAEHPSWVPQPITSRRTIFSGVDEEGGVFHWPTPAFKTLGQDGGGGLFSLVVNEIAFERIHGSQIIAGGSVLLGDAATRLCDGFQVENNSFPTAPLAMDRGITFSVGGTVYTFAVFFRRIDATGRVHRSEPVFFDTYITNEAGSSTIGSVELMGFDSCIREGWEAEVYRTAENGSVLYYIATVSINNGIAAVIPATSGGGSAITQNDDGIQVSDSRLTQNATIYTTAEVPAGHPPPADTGIWSFGNRIVLAARGGSLWVSKPMVPGLAAEFSPVLVFSAPNVNQIVAGIEIDGSAILWSEEKTYRMTGPGLSAGGTGPGYQISELASEDGCLEDSPVKLASSGAYYASKQGPCRITRSLQYEQIGLPIQPSWGGSLPAGITIDPEKHLARYYKSDGEVWCYNWQLSRWSSYQLAGVTQVASAARSDGRDYVLVRTSESSSRAGVHGDYFERDVWAEDPSSFDDEGAGYSLSWKSGWLSGQGPQGYMRVRRLALLAENLSDHTLTVNIRYDYDDTIAQTITFDESSGIAAGDDNYQFRARMNRQKCSAIQVEIVSSGGSGAELSLSNLALEVAPLSGINRLRSAQTL